MESSKETPAEVRILKRTQKGIHTLVFEQYSRNIENNNTTTKLLQNFLVAVLAKQVINLFLS